MHGKRLDVTDNRSGTRCIARHINDITNDLGVAGWVRNALAAWTASRLWVGRLITNGSHGTTDETRHIGKGGDVVHPGCAAPRPRDDGVGLCSTQNAADIQESQN